MLGVKSLSTWSGQSTPIPPDAIDPLDAAAADLIERLRVVPIAGEILGPDAALTRLDSIDAVLDADPAIDDAFRRDAATLRAIYSAPPGDSSALDPSQQDALRNRHHWFARLALAFDKPDADTARRAFAAEGQRAMIAMIAVFFALAAAALAGLVLFIVAVASLGTGAIRPALPALHHGDWADADPAAANALLESAVLFLAAFIVASALATVCEHFTGFDPTFILAWATLLLALWPLSRGLTFTQLRHALGWTRGRGILREIACGALGHLAGIPILLLGLVLSMIIITLTGADAAHPIAHDIASGGPIALVALAVMTTLWAPLVEETFFRGALFGQLRRGLPALLAAVITGLVFAVIHPQGFAGVPAIAALGFNFCLLREWRGSLIAPITAHALHNAFVTTVLFLFLI
jgi:membrane protease YdiL (CAAX protease family)